MGDEAACVGLVVQCVERATVRRCAGERRARTQFDARDRLDAVGAAIERADGVVLVALDHQATCGGERQEPQHVAARQRGHEGFLGIDRIGGRPRRRYVGGRGRGAHDAAAIEAPLVHA